MELYDISLTLSENLPTWPGDPTIKLNKISSIQDGEMSNVTQLSSTVHVGTHIDAPDHFLDNGDFVEDIHLELLVGPVQVIEIPALSHITEDDLKAADIPAGTTRILFKTANSELWASGITEFKEDYIGLESNAAKYLVEFGIKAVGVDYLSVAPYSDPGPTHQILLENKILIIEGLDLSRVEPGEYTLLCLPLKIKNADGAPARVLLTR